MKRLIRCAVETRSDPRYPLIKALEDVVGVPFEGATTYSGPTKYSKIYECYVGYKITSGRNVGTNKYRLSIRCLNKSDPYPIELVSDKEEQDLDNKSKEIIIDIAEYLDRKFPELNAEPNTRFKFITCDSYYEDDSVTDTSEEMYKEVIDMLKTHIHYDSEALEESSYRSSSEYLNIRIPGADPNSSEKKDIRNLLKENRFDVKSVVIVPSSNSGYFYDYVIKVYYK